MDKNLETAVVDLKRLQLLNDRICQTLDALNQVKLSSGVNAGQWQTQGLSGLSHSSFAGVNNVNNVAPFYGQGQLTGLSHTGYNTVNTIDPRFSMMNTIAPITGLSHTGYNTVNSIDPRFSMINTIAPIAGLSHTGYNTVNSIDPRFRMIDQRIAPSFVGGFSHSTAPVSGWQTLDPRFSNDLYLAERARLSLQAPIGSYGFSPVYGW